MVEQAINPYKSYEVQTRQLQKSFENVVTANERAVEAMKNGMAGNYAQLLKKLKVIVANSHEQYAKAGRLNFQELTRFNRIKNLEREIDKAIADNYTPIRKRIIQDQKMVIENTYSNTIIGINTAISAPIGISISPNISGQRISDILLKPWSGVSMDERMYLRQKYLGIQIKGQILRDTMGEGSTYRETAEGIEKIIVKDYAGLSKESESAAHQFQSDTTQEALDAAGEENIQLTKTWVSAGDDRVRDAHELLDGQTIDVSEMFEVPSGEWSGYKAEGPSLFGVPSLDAGCRCYIISDVKIREKD